MAANIPTTLSSWSTTASSNQPDSTDLASTLREDLQAIQAAVRYLRTSGTIASAGTTDLATKSEEILSVSGTTTITALGTVSAGMIKVLVFEDVLTFTHNGTSLILPDAGNIVTTAGDVAVMLSLGSGNWRCLNYMFADTVKTWTPVITFGTPGNLSVTHATQKGYYSKSGKTITATFTVTTSAFTHTTASGNLEVTGLPFTSQADSEGFGGMQFTGLTLSTNFTQVCPRVVSGQSKISFVQSGSTVSAAFIQAANVPSGGSPAFVGTVTYIAA